LKGLAESVSLDEARKLIERMDLRRPPVIPNQLLSDLGLKQATLPAFDIDRLDVNQKSIIGSVQGLLSIDDRTVYLKDGLGETQRSWVVLHEVGHAFIEWHRELLYLDTQYELSPAVRKTLEIEANEFAAHVLFLGDEFAKRAAVLDFGAAAIFELANVFGTSVEATVRHYVETSDANCVCLVLQPCQVGAHSTLKAQYFVKPQYGRSHWEFGGVSIGQSLPPDDETVLAFMRGEMQYPQTKRYEVESRTPGVVLRHEVFSTGHKAFVLCQAVPR
jgi:Zn-dependent peptidase ImmA (M78 family)